MKKYFLSFAFAMLCLSAFSQKIDTYDVSKKSNGIVKETIGGTEISGEVLNGLKNGTWVENHSGTELPHFIIQYVNGKKNGLYMEIEKQAALIKKIDYKDDMIDGAYYQWYKGGRLAKMCHYKKGKLNGSSVICYDRGPIQEEAEYKDGNRHGKTTWYYYVEKGQGEKAAVFNYANGDFEGEQQTFYESGKLKTSKLYSKNVQNGAAIEYYEDGSIKSECTYKNGNQGKVKNYKQGEKRN